LHGKCDDEISIFNLGVHVICLLLLQKHTSALFPRL
jgi:hypothetical protein